MPEFKTDSGVNGSVGVGIGVGIFGLAGTVDTIGPAAGTVTVGAVAYGIGAAVSVNFGTGDWSAGVGAGLIFGDGVEPGPLGVGSYASLFGGIGFSNEGTFAEIDAAAGFGPLATKPSSNGVISGVHANIRVTHLYDEIPPEYSPPSINAAIGMQQKGSYDPSINSVRDKAYGPGWTPSGQRSPTDDRAPTFTNNPQYRPGYGYNGEQNPAADRPDGVNSVPSSSNSAGGWKSGSGNAVTGPDNYGGSSGGGLSPSANAATGPQNYGGSSGSGQTTGQANSGTGQSTNVRQAPVGHRQPTAKDVPPSVDQNLGARSPEDQAVDRKLRICRDC